MVAPREMTVTYAGVSFGGSTARQIRDYTVKEADYETLAFEFTFITSAATDAAFNTEIAAVEAAFVKPRQDLTVVQNGTTFISWLQSDNTGLDATPRIVKRGAKGDTGLSRSYTVRIEFGRPADNLSQDFRRHSTVHVDISPENVKRVRIEGTYTAEVGDDETAAYAQYVEKIAGYATTVLTTIDSNATWEALGQPDINYYETNKVCNFNIEYGEIIHNQRTGTLDDADIKDPVLHFMRERVAPGDSTAGGVAPAGTSGVGHGGAGAGLDRPTVFETPTSGSTPGSSSTLERPTVIRLSYSCGIDAARTKNLRTKWQGTIRPFLIAQARVYAGTGVVLVREEPNFGDVYKNRFSAEMEFLAFKSTVIYQRITWKDSTSYGRQLDPVFSKDPLEYYEWPGPVVRLLTVNEEWHEIVSSADPKQFVDRLVVPPGGSVRGVDPAKWVLMSRTPAAPVLKKGLPGADNVFIAEAQVETVLQFRNKKGASIANAGGVTGASLTV